MLRSSSKSQELQAGVSCCTTVIRRTPHWINRLIHVVQSCRETTKCPPLINWGCLLHRQTATWSHPVPSMTRSNPFLSIKQAPVFPILLNLRNVFPFGRGNVLASRCCFCRQSGLHSAHIAKAAATSISFGRSCVRKIDFDGFVGRISSYCGR